jgi:hypothetical protein
LSDKGKSFYNRFSRLFLLKIVKYNEMECLNREESVFVTIFIKMPIFWPAIQSNNGLKTLFWSANFSWRKNVPGDFANENMVDVGRMGNQNVAHFPSKLIISIPGALWPNRDPIKWKKGGEIAGQCVGRK